MPVVEGAQGYRDHSAGAAGAVAQLGWVTLCLPPRPMCGIFGIINHKDAANLVYLGLYALQHRGQESAGIATVSHDAVFSDTNLGEPIGSSGAGEQIIAPGPAPMHLEKEMGHLARIFTHERLAPLPGDTANRPVRY